MTTAKIMIILAAAALCFIVAGLAGCATVEGMAQDIQAASKGIREAGDK